MLLNCGVHLAEKMRKSCRSHKIAADYLIAKIVRASAENEPSTISSKDLFFTDPKWQCQRTSCDTSCSCGACGLARKLGAQRLHGQAAEVDLSRARYHYRRTLHNHAAECRNGFSRALNIAENIYHAT